MLKTFMKCGVLCGLLSVMDCSSSPAVRSNQQDIQGDIQFFDESCKGIRYQNSAAAKTLEIADPKNSKSYLDISILNGDLRLLGNSGLVPNDKKSEFQLFSRCATTAEKLFFHYENKRKLKEISANEPTDTSTHGDSDEGSA